MRDIWIKLLRREGYVWQKWHKLCSDHFDWSQFEQNPEQMTELSQQTGENNFRARLKRDAVPKFNYTTTSKGPEMQSKIRIRLPEKVRGVYQKRRKMEVKNFVISFLLKY